MFRTALSILTLTTSLLIAGCGGESSPADHQSSAAWLLSSEPSDAMNISEAKKSVNEGDSIIVRGIIGGSKHPLTEDSAVFRIVDTNLYNRCTQEEGHCETPWDYCCATPEDLVTSSATVQLVDSSGSPVAVSPKSRGLKGLNEVIVVGKVGARPNSEVLTIHATGLYIAN